MQNNGKQPTFLPESEPRTFFDTGLLNRRSFSETVKAASAAEPETEFVIARWDIDRFKLFNDTFGMQKGDEMIRCLGRLFKVYSEQPGCVAAAHLDADHFAACWKLDQFVPEAFMAAISDIVKQCFLDYYASACFGFCVFSDSETEVPLICDRAMLALRDAKADYDRHYAWYDDSMFQKVLSQQEYIVSMREALNSGEFLPWYQPQYNFDTDSLIGSEALVRWVRSNGDIVGPGAFMQEFEKNGFIYELDKSVWEQVCRQQREWLDAGIDILPVSVNISRRDLYHAEVADFLCELTDRFGLDHSMLRVEITESAYMEDSALLFEAVRLLRSRGFHVEIDDFGSGFSSLNMLKDIEVDKLKLDMGFLEGKSERSGSILTSVVRLAHNIGLDVIAEGVESRRQAEFLKSIGCLEMQGYYFSRPVPAAEYTVLLNNQGSGAVREEPAAIAVDDAVEFLNADTQATLLFNSFVGGAAILEYCRGRLSVLRTNDNFHKLIGADRKTYQARSGQLQDCFAPESLSTVTAALRAAMETGQEQTVELYSEVTPGVPLWTRNRIRYLTRKKEADLFYVSLENITDQHLLSQQNSELRNMLTTLFNSVPDGLAQMKVDGDGTTFEFVNDFLASLLGYSKQELLELINRDYFAVVYPQDRDELYQAQRKSMEQQTPFHLPVRFLRRDGGVLRVDVRGSYQGTPEKGTMYWSLTDMTDLFTAENSLRVQGEEFRNAIIQSGRMICRYLFEDRSINLLSEVAKRFDSVEYIANVCEEMLRLGNVAPESIEVWKNLFAAIERGESGSVSELHLRGLSGTWHWFSVSYAPVQSGRSAVLCFEDITDDYSARLNRFFEYAGMFKALRGIYSLFVINNLTQNTYHTLERDRFIIRQEKREGIFDELISSGLCSVPEADRDAFSGLFSRENLLAAFAQGDEFVRLEHRIVGDDGIPHWVETTVLRVENPYSSDVLGLTLSRVIDERKAEDETLRRDLDLASDLLELNDKQRTVERSMSRPGRSILSYDIASHTIQVPKQIAELFGTGETVEHFPERDADIIFRAADRETADAFRQLFDGILAGVPGGGTEGRFLAADGSTVWEKLEYATIFGRDGSPARAVIFTEDTTALHNRDTELQNLRQNERILRMVARHSDRFFYFCSEDLSRAQSIDSDPDSSSPFPALMYLRTDEAAQKIAHESRETWYAVLESIDSGVDSISFKLEIRNLSDKPRWYDFRYSRLPKETCSGGGAVLSLRDITEEHRREMDFIKFRQLSELERSRCLTQVDVDLSVNLLEQHEDHSRTPLPFNIEGLPYTEALRLLASHQFEEKDCEMVLEKLNRDALLARFASGKPELKEDLPILFKSDGLVHWLRLNLLVVPDVYGRNIKAFWSLRDITEDKKHQLMLEHRADVDALTSLFNRGATQAYVEDHLSSHPEQKCLLILADVDGLKYINDNYGHQAGDAALRFFSKRLFECFDKYEDGIVGRIGGDEFIVFVPDTESPNPIRRDIASFLEALTESAELPEGLTVSGSLGCVISAPGDSFDSLYRKADTAMYRVKRSGKNSCLFYEPSMGAEAAANTP